MPPEKPSCATCAHSDLAVRSDEPVRECHLLPPMTVPSSTPVEVAEEEDEGEWGSVGVELPDFDYSPHRYPVVTAADWCSYHKEAR